MQRQVTGAVLALIRQLRGCHIAILGEEVSELLFSASFGNASDIDLREYKEIRDLGAGPRQCKWIKENKRNGI